MAVVTAEAVGERATAGRDRIIRVPRVARPRGLAPATLGLIGTLALAGGVAAALSLTDPTLRILALVAVGAGGYLVGRAGVAPPPDDDDLRRRDELLRARERALMDREGAVDGALVSLALRGDDRAAPAAQPEPAQPDELEPLEAPDVDREPRSRRPGILRVFGPADDGDDDGLAPAGSEVEGP